MDQERLNKKVLTYLQSRIGNPKYQYCTVEFIRTEVVRNVEIEDYKLAEALKQAYYKLKENEKT